MATLATLASLHVHMWNMKMWTRGSWAALWSGVALANTAYLAKPGLSYTFIWFIVVIMTIIIFRSLSGPDHNMVHNTLSSSQSQMCKTVIICNAQSFVKDSKIWTRSLWHKFFQLFPPSSSVPTSILLRLIMFVIDRVEDTTKRPRVSACAPPGTLRPFCNVAAVAEEGKKYKSGQFHK